MTDVLRIAIMGTRAEAAPVIASAERILAVDAVHVSGDVDWQAFDAVGFCRTSGDQMPSIGDVARSGKHLLIDLAALKDGEETNALVDACRAASVQFMIAQPDRYRPSIQAVRESLTAGQLGAPGMLRIHRWIAKSNEATGPLLLREIDLANFLFDQPPTTVYALARGGEDSPQLVQVHLGFSGGAMALIDVVAGLPEGDGYYSLSLIGSNGSAYVDDHHNMQLVFKGGPAMADPTRETSRHWTEPLRQFSSAIAEKQQGAVGVDSALAALRVSEAVGRAIETGSVQHLQGDRYEGE